VFVGCPEQRQFPSQSIPRKPTAVIPETGGNFKKDVKFIRNELNKPFRINKRFKKRNQKNTKQSAKTCQICIEKPKKPFSEQDSMLRPGPFDPGLRSE